jgi:hypothetical protein
MCKIEKMTWGGNGQTCFSNLKTKFIQIFKKGSSHFQKNMPHHRRLEDVMVKVVTASPQPALSI